MSQMSDEEPQIGRGGTIEKAAEDAARRLPQAIQGQQYQLSIYAEVSGEHNPLHGYIVVLSPGGP
jgi:hypothetical protein